MIVPFPPGGSTDILGRAIAAKLQESLGQPVVVENKPGAGGSIGATEAARSAGDGHTLLMGHIGMLAINPSLYPNLPYDPRKSFAPVALVARVPNVLVVNHQVPVKDVADSPRRSPGSFVTHRAATAARRTLRWSISSCARLETEGAEAAPGTPAAFGSLINGEIARWKPVVERANVRPE